MNKLEDIKKILKQSKEELRKKYGVVEIGIFGSYVRSKQYKNSDLDILVEFEPDPKIDLINFIELENYISELLGIKVDLVMKSVLKPRIGRQILKETVYL